MKLTTDRKEEYASKAEEIAAKLVEYLELYYSARAHSTHEEADAAYLMWDALRIVQTGMLKLHGRTIKSGAEALAYFTPTPDDLRRRVNKG